MTPHEEEVGAALESGAKPLTIMNLDDAQRAKVAEWLAQGQKLSEIQSRLASELGVIMTYMDVRFLVDDLKLTPKDSERPKPTVSFAPPPPPVAAPARGLAPAEAPVPGGVPKQPLSVKVDQIARPGAVVSGKVTFSDGNSADWYFDQTGRLGLVPQSPGYRPPAADLQEFQAALDGELSKMGF